MHWNLLIKSRNSKSFQMKNQISNDCMSWLSLYGTFIVREAVFKRLWGLFLDPREEVSNGPSLVGHTRYKYYIPLCPANTNHANLGAKIQIWHLKGCFSHFHEILMQILECNPALNLSKATEYWFKVFALTTTKQ